MHYGYYGPFWFFARLAPLIVIAALWTLQMRRRGACRSSTSVVVPPDTQDPQYRAWREDPLTPVQPPAGTALDFDETAYYCAPASIAEQPVTSSTGTDTASGSQPNMKVVRLSMNVQAGSSSNSLAPAAVSSGTLTITNKRLLYASSDHNFAQSFDVPGTILVPLSTGVALVPKQGGEGLFFKTGDPVAGIILQRAMSKTLVAVAPPEPPKWHA
jgi:hypothetical protein